TLPTPVTVGPGSFFVGIQQTNSVNASLSYDNEVPVRQGSFFLATSSPPTGWFDFSPGNNVKPNIGITLVQCQNAAECNDNNVCTNDACTSQVCVHTNNSVSPCDSSVCTTSDHCAGGACVPGPSTCDDNDACTVDLCDAQGGCSHAPQDCNDNNACTSDSCAPASGCAHANVAGSCSDGDPCTLGDACSAGVCVPGTQ